MPKITTQNGGAKTKPTVKRGASLQWEDISGLDPFVKIAIYGRSGSGKTTLWATFPKPIGVMICSGAGETKSISNVPGIRAVKLTDESQFLEKIEEQRETKQFKTFVLDHASYYQDMVLSKVLGREVPQQLSWGFAQRDDYAKTGLRMKENLVQMLRLNCHVVIVAQERAFNTDEDSSGGVLAPYVNCALLPSVTGWLGPQVDYLVETFLRMQTVEEKTKVQGKEIIQTVQTGKVEFCLRTAPHPVYETKFRIPRGTELPESIVDPSYDKIAKLIAGK